MTTYRVLMHTGVALAVEVEATDRQQAEELAAEVAQSRVEAGSVEWHAIDWEHDNWTALDVQEG